MKPIIIDPTQQSVPVLNPVVPSSTAVVVPVNTSTSLFNSGSTTWPP